MVLDFLPYKVPETPRKKIGWIRYLTFVASLVFVSALFLAQVGNFEKIMFWAFTIGNVLYYTVAIILAFGPIDLSAYLKGVDHVTVGGETGREARICDYDWVLDIRKQCLDAGVTFWFKNTGSLFKKDGVVSKINPYKQSSTAKELGIDKLDGKKFF